MKLLTNESELIVACAAGDRQAMEKFYRLYSDKMFAVCIRYTKNKDLATDVLQEGFLKAFKSIKNFGSRGSLEGWLRRIMVNTALDQYRKHSKLHIIEEYDDDLSEDKAFEALEKIEMQDLLDLISELPEGYRVIFNMYAIEGYSHKEIGEKLGINAGTSKSQLSRARDVLKKKIALMYREGDQIKMKGNGR